MQKFIDYRFAAMLALAAAFLASAPATKTWAGSIVKVRLVSFNPIVEADGTATLQGQKLTGHLTGNGVDVVLTGLVKSQSVSVELTGSIVPSCGLLRQSMSGIGTNENENTSIDMTFQCSSKGGSAGEDYRFLLNLPLPSRPLYSPSLSAPGESASLD
jgi:hypothetical protein